MRTQNTKKGHTDKQFGVKLRIYKAFPISKGSTSPFTPIWINEMDNRQC